MAVHDVERAIALQPDAPVALPADAGAEHACSRRGRRPAFPIEDDAWDMQERCQRSAWPTPAIAQYEVSRLRAARAGNARTT